MSDPCAEWKGSSRVSCLIPVGLIYPNPDQPRKHFDDYKLMELASSIRQYGLLQPVTVLEKDGRFELVMGERRLRACKMLGLSHIDAFVLSAHGTDSALLALVENIQREELHFLEEAEAYQAILRTGVSQEMLARRLGKSVSAVANKTRLLHLETEVRQLVQDEGLTERHARALLRLPPGESRFRIAREAAQRHWTVRETEERISREMRLQPDPNLPRRVISLARDPRLYVNAIRAVVEQMQKAGVCVRLMVEERGEDVTVTVTLPGGARTTAKCSTRMP